MEFETMKKIIGILDVAIVKEKAYISNRFYNSLIIYNINKGTIEHIERFIHMDASSFAYHGGCIEHDGIIYFYPDNGYGIHTYDTERGCQKYYDLGFCRIGYSCIFEEKIILFPWYSEQGLIIIDLKEKTIQNKSDWWRANDILEDAKTNFLNSGKYDNHKVWSHCTRTNQLIVSDCHEHKIKKYRINIDGKILWGSQYDGTDFWFTAVDEAVIYQWNIRNGLKNSFNFELAAWQKTHEVSPYRKLVCVQDYVFIIPYDENAIFILNKETEKMEMLSKFPEGIIYPKTKYWSIKEKIGKNQLYLFCDLTNLIIQIDMYSLNVKYINTQIDNNKLFDKYKEEIWKSILLEMNDKDCLVESEYDWKICLPSFIRFEREMSINNTKFLYDNKIGNKIYRKVVTE